MIRDETDLAAHIECCWANPVKHGLVARPLDWPHSSLHRAIAEGAADPAWAEAASPDPDRRRGERDEGAGSPR